MSTPEQLYAQVNQITREIEELEAQRAAQISARAKLLHQLLRAGESYRRIEASTSPRLLPSTISRALEREARKSQPPS